MKTNPSETDVRRPRLIRAYFSVLVRFVRRSHVRVLILSHGSRGDVQPFVALARELSRTGHEVRLALPFKEAPLADGCDVDVFRFKDRSRELAANPRYHHSVKRRYRGWEYLPQAFRSSGHILAGVLGEVAAAASDGADVVVHTHAIHGHQVAERLGVPAIAVDPLPGLVPTSAFANPMFPFHLPRAFNRASYRWTPLMIRGVFGPTDRWRAEVLDLPPRRSHADPMLDPDGTPATVLHPFSPRLFPAPPGYPDWVHTTGYWFLPAPPTWSPPPQLVDFLDDHRPTVYVGFGSLAGVSPRQTGQIVADAARRAGVRALVVAGTGAGIQVDERADDIMGLGDVPFDWLFPRVAAVVHHGGIGTTGAALAAGRPQVACPFIPSQRFVARRIVDLGVSPGTVEHHRLTSERLAAAIGRAVSDETVAARARALSKEIRAEEGLTTAVSIIEEQVAAARA